ncbi:Eukaryotic translation initiation factor 4E-1 [Yarrowia sp. C11]|nr:Eukaryotic translation initiation factor 4E-1 [Yarrowia sp. C11]
MAATTDNVTEAVANLSIKEETPAETVEEEIAPAEPFSTVFDSKTEFATVVSFDTVEGFWAVYNNIPKLVELPFRSDYAFFRKGIRPEWECDSNKAGGKWFYQFKPKSANEFDEIWLHTVLSVIGESLETDEDIAKHEGKYTNVDGSASNVNGIFVNIRKAGVRFNVWTKTSEVTDELRQMGVKIKQVLRLPEKEELLFQSHEESASKNVKSQGKTRLAV